MHKADIAVFNDGVLEGLHSEVVLGNYTRAYQLRRLGELVRDQLWGHGHVDYVFIEQNLVGNNVKYSISLAQSVGAIAGALNEQIEFVNVSTWKKSVVGAGNAKKDEVRNYVDKTFPEYTALCEGSQDRYDAICIGLYGVGLIDLAAQLKLEKL